VQSELERSPLMEGLAVRSGSDLREARRTAVAGHIGLEVVPVVRHVVHRTVEELRREPGLVEVLAADDHNLDAAEVVRRAAVVEGRENDLAVDKVVGRSLVLDIVTAWRAEVVDVDRKGVKGKKCSEGMASTAVLYTR